jgi:hypothetical protein
MCPTRPRKKDPKRPPNADPVTVSGEHTARLEPSPAIASILPVTVLRESIAEVLRRLEINEVILLQ